jgi:hypothetical protein
MPDTLTEYSERSESNADPSVVVEESEGDTMTEEDVSYESSDPADGKGRGFVVTFFAVICLSVLLQVFHLYISTPIAPGSVVPPRVWLNKCGLSRFVTNCDDAFLHVGKDGNVVGYDSKKQIAWEIEGAVCSKANKSCIPGMQFTKDLKVIVGGKPIVYVNKRGVDSPLSPWPFEEEPKLKTMRKNQ